MGWFGSGTASWCGIQFSDDALHYRQPEMSKGDKYGRQHAEKGRSWSVMAACNATREVLRYLHRSDPLDSAYPLLYLFTP